MKYLRTFEGLNRKTVDPNKIYFFSLSRFHDLIGKIDLYDNDYAPVMKGVILQTDEPGKAFIKKQYWRTIREATPEEIKKYKFFDNLNKYNL